MKLEFISKSLDYLNSDPYRTKVVLGNSEGAFYPIYFDKDAISKSDAELLDLATEKIYQDNFPGRAENEKFNAIGERLAEIDDITEEATKNLKKVKEEAKLSASSRLSFLKIMTLLYEKGILTDEELFATGIFDEGLEDTDETINE